MLRFGLMCVGLGVPLALYVSSGVADAYFAADDFQWLLGGQGDPWSHLFTIDARNHFYRPVADLWFSAAWRVCGTSAPCYHFASLALHLLNVALAFRLALVLFGDVRVAFLGMLLFAVQPAYTEAVVWVSAVNGLLLTAFYLGSLLCLADASKAGGSARTIRDVLSVVLFILAVFSHESGITLPAMASLVYASLGAHPRRLPAAVLVGQAAVVVAFAVAAVAANRDNYVFTEGHYTLGAHLFRNALDYIVNLYVGPHSALGYIAGAVTLALLLVLSPASRFGALWVVVTLVPYLGFTWGTTSRYAYLPAVGFGLAVAAGGVALHDRIARRVRPEWVAASVLFVAAAFLVIRLGVFASKAVARQVAWLDGWRVAARQLADQHQITDGATATVTLPGDSVVDPIYIEPLLRWELQRPELRVIVEPRIIQPR